jgi:phosphoglycerol transferase MdoB-like AlkP superfamily enzyme
MNTHAFFAGWRLEPGRWHSVAAALAVLVVGGALWAIATVTAASSSPFLSASPNPVPLRFASTGSTEIRWQAPADASAEVWVARDEEPESLFASGRSGRQTVDWVATGSVYDFRLYTSGPPRRLEASVRVTRRDDAYAAFELALAGLSVLGLVIVVGARRRWASWFIESGLPALVLAAVLVKLTYMSTALRPGWGFIPPDRHTISATVAVLLCCWAALTLIERRRRAIAVVVLAMLMTTIGVADLVHARYFDDVMTVTQLSSAPQLLSVIPSVRALLKPRDGLYYVDVLVFVLALPIVRRLSTRGEQLRRSAADPLAGGRQQPFARRSGDRPGRGGVPVIRLRLAAMLLAAGAVAATPSYRLMLPSSLQNNFSRRATVAMIGLPAYHVSDIAAEVMAPITRSLAVSEAGREDAIRWVEQNKSSAQQRSPLFGAARASNLILISAESLNAFPIGLAIDGRPVTPNLDRLASESLYFTSFFDQAHLGSTSDGELLALESLYPLPDGPVATRFATNTYFGLPAVLTSHGYDSFSAVGATGETWNVAQMHPRHGFLRSYFDRDMAPGERIAGWLSDRAFFSQMLERLDAAPQPFVAFVLSSSSHLPYELPAHLRTIPVGRLDGTMLGRYLQSVHYFDSAIGEFVEGLRRRGLLDRSILAIYGDHQGYLDELDRAADLLGVPSTDRVGRWRIRKTVPFTVRLPGAKAAGAYPVIGGHLDIAPTLLGLLGVEAGAAMLGRDLTQGQGHVVAFRDGSFVSGQGYFFQQQPGSPTCFDPARKTMDCKELEAHRLEAVERLRVSDTIIRGDLVPRILGVRER